MENSHIALSWWIRKAINPSQANTEIKKKNFLAFLKRAPPKITKGLKFFRAEVLLKFHILCRVLGSHSGADDDSRRFWYLAAKTVKLEVASYSQIQLTVYQSVWLNTTRQLKLQIYCSW